MSDIATLESARVDLPSGTLEDLRGAVRGAVLEPGDPGQQDVRAVFNAMHPSNPALTVRCSGTADVIAGVNFARRHGLTLAVRGGGHSIAGLSAAQGGMLLDLADMRGVQVDAERRLAVVQGGAVVRRQVRTASADSHPDLFWALRGGGGNFGVVTSFTFALQPLGPIVGFSAPSTRSRRSPRS
jgi:FAD/FMN-containing dehydrogenase